MPATRSAPRRAPRTRAKAPLTYWDTSRQPLQILVYLLPLILFYEISIPHLIASQGQDVKAHAGIVQFFEAVGITSGALYFGGLVIIVVLLLWHFLEHKAWKIDLTVCITMAAESVLLIIPLLVLGRAVGDAHLFSTAPATATAAGFSSWSAWDRITLSIGAGLYEELLFRMLLIAVIHTLIVDVGKASHATGAIIAIAVSACAFTVYHPLHAADGHTLLIHKTIFLFLAGTYFGALYVIRGFGIVVAVHALYDIITLILIPSVS